MKAAVRPLRGEDLLRGADRLRALVYPDHPEAQATAWHCSVWGWLARHPLATEMHRWVAVAEGGDLDGEVVGHLAALPQHYRVNGERIVAHTPADFQVLPGYGFHAISLMRRFFRTAENCVSVDRVEEAIAIETRFGAEKVGRLRCDAKVLDLSRVPRAPARLRPLLGPATLGLRALDRVLGGVFAGKHEVVALDGFDGSFDGLFEGVAAAVPCLAEKDAAFLRWRYGPGSPAYPVTVLGVRAGEALLGYAVLRVAREGGDGHLLDLTVRPGRRDVARSLLRGAVRHFAKAGAYVVRYRFVESATSPQAEDLWSLGFFSRGERRHTLLVRFSDPGMHETALHPAHWSYSAGDGEMTFWVG